MARLCFLFSKIMIYNLQSEAFAPDRFILLLLLYYCIEKMREKKKEKEYYYNTHNN